MAKRSTKKTKAKEPKNNIIEEPKEETIEEPKEEVKVEDVKTKEPKESVVEEPKEEVVEEPKEEAKVEEAKEEPKKEPKETLHYRIIQDYLNQYIEYVKQSQPKKAILALNNLVTNLLKNFDAKAMELIIKTFKENKEYVLDERYALQAIETIPRVSRFKMEIVYGVILKLASNLPFSVSIDKIREYSQSQDFTNYCIRKLKK